MIDQVRVSAMLVGAAAAVLCLSGTASADNESCVDNGQISDDPTHWVVPGGQVNFSGASLFVNFFMAPAATNDWIDVDGDGRWGRFAQFPFTDQLAGDYPPTPTPPLNTWWMFNFRSVGSVNGFNEFVENQLCNAYPYSIPTEAGLFNRFQYAEGGVALSGGVNRTGTPYRQCEIEGAFLDVPGAWAVRVDGPPAWNRPPTSPGYGLNPTDSSTGYPSQLQSLSRVCGICTATGEPCVRDTNCPDYFTSHCTISGERCQEDADCPEPEETCEPDEVCDLTGGASYSLNTNTANPDEDTIFDYVAAWVPVALIANRGADVEDIKYSEAQYLFTTGRMPNGENLVAASRDVGSGTRNAAMNSLGIDTSWGRGENIGDKNNEKSQGNLGPGHQASNCGGSSIMEQVVEMRRGAIGYTGLAGSSRAAKDAMSGKFEVLNVCKDVAGVDCDFPYGLNKRCTISRFPCETDSACPFRPQETCDDQGGYVRPSVDTVLDNCDPAAGYQIAGSGSFAVRGNIHTHRVGKCADHPHVMCYTLGSTDECPDPGEACLADPKYVSPVDAGEPLNNEAVAHYLLNVLDSAASFAGDPGASESELMPGEFLATKFFMPPAIDCVHLIDDPLL